MDRGKVKDILKRAAVFPFVFLILFYRKCISQTHPNPQPPIRGISLLPVAVTP